MVRTVNCTVAIQTGPEHHLLGRQRAAGKAGAAEWLTIVRGAIVTVLAQEWRALLEQAGLHGSVRRVTNCALFLNGCVLPQERPAFFVVA